MNETMLLRGIAVKVNASTYGVVAFAGDPVWNSSSLTVVLHPIGGLDYDTKYTVIVSGSYFDGVKDMAGNSLDGDKDGDSEGSPMDDHRFVFTTPDPIPPYVVETIPYSDEENVTQNTFINATFDDIMDESTLTSDNFTVKDGNNDTVSGQLTYNPQSKTLSFDPDQNLRPGMTYTVNIGNAKDSDGNQIAEPYVWSFTTALDYDPPVVTIIAPPDGYATTQGDDVVISGTAFDNSGIQSLLIQIGDGSQIDITERYNPADGSWNYTWDTGDTKSGEVVIIVTAYDLLLLSGSDEVSVEVKKRAGEDLTWLILVVFAVILAVFAILLFLFMWRKRRQAAEDELIAEEVREEMWEEREAEEEEALEEVSEPGEAAEGDEVEEEPEEELDLDIDEPARRMKK